MSPKSNVSLVYVCHIEPYVTYDACALPYFIPCLVQTLAEENDVIKILKKER